MKTLKNAGRVRSSAEGARGRARWLVLAAPWGWAATCAACSSESDGGAMPDVVAAMNGGSAGRAAGAVAVWLAHPENDETVTFDNGEPSGDRWLDANACAETSAPISPDPREEYSGCGEGAAVRWCVYQHGHSWPDFASQGIWEFFSSL